MKYRPRKATALNADEMAAFDGFHDLGENFLRLLHVRGINTPEKVRSFFDVSPDRLHDPFGLTGMTEAVDRIERAISNKETILLIGDYDADGICSVAILYKYFCTRRTPTRYFLPDRNSDGYGLTCALIDQLSERFQPKLIITVDCGISCHAEIEHAKALGIDCIVTDHHAIPDKIPECVCLNAKLPNQKYPFRDLCGAGMALKLVHALGGLEAALRYVDICAIATVADIVSLTDENRSIVTLGLRRLNQNSLPSITALAKSCHIQAGFIKSPDISFKLGPKINASGRMGNAKRGLDIILEQDRIEIEKIIRNLAEYNTRRQKLCNDIYNQVEERINSERLYKNNIIIIADSRWESGVLGIVAARLTEKFGKPSIVFGIHDNIVKGSGRSIEGIDLVKVVDAHSDLVTSFGGHAMATGLTLPLDNYPTFVERVTNHMNENFSQVNLTAEKVFDFPIDFGDLTMNFVDTLEKLEPTGCGNPIPSFLTTVTACDVSPLNAFQAHIKFNYRGVQFLFFNGWDCGEVLSCNCPKQVLIEIQRPDGTNTVKAVAKSIFPIPTDQKSYAITLSGWLLGSFDYEPDIKFQGILQGLSCERDVFIENYKVIKQAHEREANGIYELYELLAPNNKIDLYQFTFCASVFRQLGILSFLNGTVRINDRNATDLFESGAYNKIREMDYLKVEDSEEKWQKA